MEKLGLNEIRERYLSFFEGKGHLRMPSFSLVPQNDPSLLLINAGMAPLKPYFTGARIPPRKRVTTCQKCIRTPDIERVGHTARHGTFFEMLGNFSFGDYFKHEATAWAWEFITKDLKMPVDKLWVTIYLDDDEAFDIWTKEVGVDPSHIVRLGKEDNFWEHGTGPCGPCSEIYFDRGVEKACSPDCKLGCDCDRYVEFWNLVFTQFDKDEEGNYNRLPNPNIDTGMGLERLAAIMQGVDNLFEVDTVRNIMMHICDIAGVKYNDNENTDVSLRVVTDHIRSTTMMISDGVLPSNEGRGYVLRRLLRRAARHGRLLGIKGAFLADVAGTVIKESGNAYPQLVEKADYIKKIISVEEGRFNETIDNGLLILNEYIDQTKKEGKSSLSGEKAFKLYDTYGFPLDLTVEILAEQDLSVDKEEFDRLMQNQKDTARTSRKDGSSWDAADTAYISVTEATNFVGYENDTQKGKILFLATGGEGVSTLSAGMEGIIITDTTVFYGEGGGQVGDTGIIIGDKGKAQVIDTKKNHDGVYMHIAKVLEGEFNLEQTVTLAIDKDRRDAVSRNHSTTHMLQKALKMVLGGHVEQAGSYVDEKRLRFDFAHFEAMTPDQIAQVEDIVNKEILAGDVITTQVLPINEAKKLGATALFGEKYGDNVRVVKMGDFSIEFCGGCHLTNTANAGMFKLLSETGVAAGVRRIEGVTGLGVLEYIREKNALISKTAEALKTTEGELITRANGVINEIRDLKSELEAAKSKLAGGMLDEIISLAQVKEGVSVIATPVKGMKGDELRTLCDKIKDKLPCSAMIIASESDGKITFVGMATKEAVAKGIHIGNTIKAATLVVGGNGGGKPDMAQGAGKDVSKINDAIEVAKQTLLDMIK
ncbi:MAG: alanine--tRNA ligase [Clostridia bacterium]|nr:alanine--tRNA ligase [Clostridia bacterium]